MPNMKLLAAQRNLANAELLGHTERAKRIRAKIAKLEKADRPVVEPVEMVEPAKPSAAKSKTATKTATKKEN